MQNTNCHVSQLLMKLTKDNVQNVLFKKQTSRLKMTNTISTLPMILVEVCSEQQHKVSFILQVIIGSFEKPMHSRLLLIRISRATSKVHVIDRAQTVSSYTQFLAISHFSNCAASVPLSGYLKH